MPTLPSQTLLFPPLISSCVSFRRQLLLPAERKDYTCKAAAAQLQCGGNLAIPTLTVLIWCILMLPKLQWDCPHIDASVLSTTHSSLQGHHILHIVVDHMAGKPPGWFKQRKSHMNLGDYDPLQPDLVVRAAKFAKLKISHCFGLS